MIGSGKGMFAKTNASWLTNRILSNPIAMTIQQE
jgi:hypothetical protein